MLPARACLRYFCHPVLQFAPNQQLPENHFHLSLFLKIPGALAALACRSAMILKLGQGELSYNRSPCTRKRTETSQSDSKLTSCQTLFSLLEFPPPPSPDHRVGTTRSQTNPDERVKGLLESVSLVLTTAAIVSIPCDRRLRADAERGVGALRPRKDEGALFHFRTVITCSFALRSLALASLPIAVITATPLFGQRHMVSTLSAKWVPCIHLLMMLS